MRLMVARKAHPPENMPPIGVFPSRCRKPSCLAQQALLQVDTIPPSETGRKPDPLHEETAQRRPPLAPCSHRLAVFAFDAREGGIREGRALLYA